MKKLIVLIFSAMLANNAMEEQPYQQTTEEKNASLEAKHEEMSDLIEEEFVLILPGIKRIRMACFNGATLEMIKQHLYAHYHNKPMPLPIEGQVFYPFRYSTDTVMVTSYPLRASDNKKSLFGIMNEHNTNTFMVFGPLRPLSIDFNKKIAALIANNKTTQKN